MEETEAASAPPLPVPDRLSVDKASPFYDMATARKIRIWFDAGTGHGFIEQKGRVSEYCISEGWVKRYLPTGSHKGFKAERGRRLAFKTLGIVKVEWNTDAG